MCSKDGMKGIWTSGISQSLTLSCFHSGNVAVYQQLQEYEQMIFGSSDVNSNPVLPVFQSSFSFGFPKPNDGIPVPTFNNLGATSIFARPNLDNMPHEFTFGAVQTQMNSSGVPFAENQQNPNSNDISMDGSWFPSSSFRSFPDINGWTEVGAALTLMSF